MLNAAPQTDKSRIGYYTIHIPAAAGHKLPYIVFAASDLHAARLVRDETGYMAHQHEVEGPYLRV